MEVQDLAAIAEIVGAIAVVVSLIYVAVQIRQNTSAIRASAVHTSLSYAFDNRAATFTDEQTSTIYYKGLKNPSDLNEIELLRFRLIMSNLFDAVLNLYAQTKKSEFLPENWQAQSKIVERVLDSEGGQWFWSEFKDNYPKSFQEELARIIDGRT